jgi:hypothetical protein
MDGLLAAAAFVMCAALLFLRRRWSKQVAVKPMADFDRLAEVVKNAEVANDGFFRALELVQKNLETLIARAETTEQRLRSLMLQPGIDRREQYTAAALLLAEGQDVERVASMLNLPHAQVHLIRDLQQVTGKEKRPGVRPRRPEQPAASETARPSKAAAPREKNAARPVLLVDAIKNAASVPLSSEPQRANLKGVTA